MILFKKQLFDLEVKGQGPTKVITVCNTPTYGHAPTYQISLTYLKTQTKGSQEPVIAHLVFNLTSKVDRKWGCYT